MGLETTTPPGSTPGAVELTGLPDGARQRLSIRTRTTGIILAPGGLGSGSMGSGSQPRISQSASGRVRD
jgi:hypothetical protein